MKRIFGLLTLLLGLGSAAFASAQTTPQAACAPEGQAQYLCGMANVEDMVLAPGGKWIVASSMTSADAPVGHLYAIDAAARTFKAIAPVLSHRAQPVYAGCPGPPDLSRFAPHGLGLRPGAGRSTLYVVNHGGREAIEVFWLTSGAGGPALRWVGCALLPDKGSGNGVAPLAGGGFVASKFEEAGDPKAFDKMAAGETTGAVYAWAPGRGFRKLPMSDLSGANGVEASKDGRWILVNAWPEGKVVRFAVDGSSRPVSVATDFLPDNLRQAPDGEIFVAGQASDMKTLLSCKEPRCPHAWAVSRLDPETMTLTPVVRIPGTDAFSDATSALQVGQDLWIGTYRGDRVAVVPVR